MHLDEYLGTTQQAQTALADAFRQVGDAHRDEPDLAHLCDVLAAQCDAHAARLKPFAPADAEAPAHSFAGPRSGPLGLLRDLLDLYVPKTRIKQAAPQTLVVA